MESRNSTFEILKILRVLENESSHGRELARKTGFSHTYINKLLSTYYKKGILDREKHGKTLIYSIKRNKVSEQLLIIEKKDRIIELMEKDKEFKIIIEEIIEKIEMSIKNIDCIILYGSYADFTYRNDSDIDLFFITELSRNEINEKVRLISEKYGKEISIKVNKLDDFVENREEALIREVLKGIPLFNSELFYKLKWI